MPKIIHRTLIVLALGAEIVIAGMPAFAQDTATNSIDLGNLIFFKGAAYSVTYEDSVSRDTISAATVRKIGYGHTNIVNITTTSSGVYSSDGMTSPHIRYPGVHVEQVAISQTGGSSVAPATGDDSYRPLAYWSDRRGWVATPTVDAGSFVIVTHTPTGTIITGTTGSCFLGTNAAIC